MVRINLLPWRTQEREERKQAFLVITAGAVVVSLFVALMMHVTMAAKIHSQRKINQYFTDQITQLDRKIQEVKEIQQDKARLINKIKIIQQLEMRRTLVTHLFAEMVKLMPDGLYLTAIKKEGPKISLMGKAESNTRVSEFMRNIDASEWVTKPILTEIKNTGDNAGTVRDFSLEIQLKGDSLMDIKDDGTKS
jgi:type IV pilus assembly protein PilN